MTNKLKGLKRAPVTHEHLRELHERIDRLDKNFAQFVLDVATDSSFGRSSIQKATDYLLLLGASLAVCCLIVELHRRFQPRAKGRRE